MSHHPIFRPFLLFMSLCAAPALAALSQTVVVSPHHLHGWQVQTSGTARVEFVEGPAPTPMGRGSVQFETGTNGDSVAQVRDPHYSGTLLNQLRSLQYSTYVAQNGGCQAPYLILNIDTDHDGRPDDTLYFEPCYQTGTYGGDPVPSQCSTPACVVLHEWQRWDALEGGWWAASEHSGGPPLITLSHYAALHPGARIVNAAGGAGGVHIAAGGGAPVWDDFLGYADALVIEERGRETTYDFEPDLCW